MAAMDRSTLSNLDAVLDAADGRASEMARAAHAIASRGDPETAEALLEMVRHNRIVALKLRAERGLERDRTLAFERRRTNAP